MDTYVRQFIKASLVWLGAGATLGVAMAAAPQWSIYRPAHVHMNLLGFVTMMIYGVAYHVIPRFTGNALHSPRLARLHVLVANGGLALMVAAFGLRPHVGQAATPMLAAGGVMAAVGAYLFVYVLWRTIDGAADASAARAQPSLTVPLRAGR